MLTLVLGPVCASSLRVTLAAPAWPVSPAAGAARPLHSRAAPAELPSPTMLSRSHSLSRDAHCSLPSSSSPLPPNSTPKASSASPDMAAAATTASPEKVHGEPSPPRMGGSGCLCTSSRCQILKAANEVISNRMPSTAKAITMCAFTSTRSPAEPSPSRLSSACSTKNRVKPPRSISDTADMNSSRNALRPGGAHSASRLPRNESASASIEAQSAASAREWAMSAATY
mmetsp:Transcript_19937/g.64724  ORF Transcript_19937/g.64724 Transcript_19937/m.64724 type:complete len:228 (-) Transcript_19937:165-848(-)